ncbi:uroporphyrinogen-III C-methyltransferase [Corynebacterium sp. 13CS0277]|uniref:uroporphyrinogen-III C-methyltransferase n=1 Tax=Corynebacterium sp. 13CS0277 TaxID=2071994 RepID=UPI000D02CE46|nr:uroporphyrinogen-III C-methyltransferase [Corynebacterium sp. 13CS0277]PRQ12588.1 uroporphyrinogen-III C-methyltransferase [Corynebacterium sp. 13CS0277]
MSEQLLRPSERPSWPVGVPPVSLIGGGPGAWDLITVRGMLRLQAADVIVADHLGPTAELEKLVDTTAVEIIDASKLPYGRQVAQERINQYLVDFARQGKKVARLKGGDPYVFGRGFEELQALAEAGIDCEVIPGVTSAISVPAAAGVPVTQRGVVHSFTVVSGHVPPGHPKSLTDFDALAKVGGTISIIMGVKNGPKIAAALLDAGKPADTPVAIIQEGTTAVQRSVRCTLGNLGATLAAEEIAPPAVIVIGEVASL